MAIQLAGGTNRNDVYAGIATYPALLQSINTTLVAAGWTSAPQPVYNIFTHSGQPNNNDNLYLAANTYTFKTAINNATPREILIGASALDTWNNFIACVTGGVGSGTLYSSASAADTVFTAVRLTSTTVQCSSILTGPTLVSYAIGESVTNAVLSFTGASTRVPFAGYKWTSARTPQNLQVAVHGRIADFDSGGTASQVRFGIFDESGVAICPSGFFTGRDIATSTGGFTYGGRLGAANLTLPSSTWRVIANKYQFFVFADTLYSGGGIFVAAGVPWIPDFLAPLSITAATNASPIAITTSVAHGWTTGDVIATTGIGGNTAANGNFTVTVTGTTTATLGGSTGNGTYTSGGYAGKLNSNISSLAWISNSYNSSTPLFYGSNVASDFWGQILNGSVNTPGTAAGTGSLSIVVANSTKLQNGADALRWYNNDVLVSEPVLLMGTTDAGTGYLVGQLWDAFFHCKSESGGTTGTFNSKNWYLITNNVNGGANEKEGALVHKVP